MSQLALQLKAAMAAIEEAGLTPSQIDGIMPFPNLGRAEEFAANLGCQNLRFATTVHMGGAAPAASLQLAGAAVEAGIAQGWHRWVDDVVSIDRFGASAPGATVMRELGIDVDNVVARVRSLIGA